MKIGGIPSPELGRSPGVGGILSSGTGWWVFKPKSELEPLGLQAGF